MWGRNVACVIDCACVAHHPLRSVARTHLHNLFTNWACMGGPTHARTGCKTKVGKTVLAVAVHTCQLQVTASRVQGCKEPFDSMTMLSWESQHKCGCPCMWIESVHIHTCAHAYAWAYLPLWWDTCVRMHAANYPSFWHVGEWFLRTPCRLTWVLRWDLCFQLVCRPA